jgi:hypothetical protein
LPDRCKYTDTLLKVDHVSLSYDDKIILRDVNAEIRDIVRPDCPRESAKRSSFASSPV